MDQIRIAADSSCDLLTMDGVDFVSVPLTVRTAVEEFRDDAALDVDAMVTTLRGTKGRTFSACPNIADWESAFGESGEGFVRMCYAASMHDLQEALTRIGLFLDTLKQK